MRRQITPERVAELRAMPYADYLKTPEWHQRRAVALKVFAYRCQLCNSSESLQVHHRAYDRLGQEHWIDLVVLCDACHTLFHTHRRLCRDRHLDGLP